MMNFDGSEVAKEFEEAFGRPVNTLTKSQLWWLVKVAKHIRGRCRNNAALNNYLARNFGHASFRNVSNGEYDHLEISIRGQE